MIGNYNHILYTLNNQVPVPATWAFFGSDVQKTLYRSGPPPKAPRYKGPRHGKTEKRDPTTGGLVSHPVLRGVFVKTAPPRVVGWDKWIHFSMYQYQGFYFTPFDN